MSGLPWYKCDPARFNDGMIGLTKPERGVYVTVINAIYIEGGPVKDDPVYWAHVFGCTQAGWLKDRDALVAKGKLFSAPTQDGLPGLFNRKCAEEIDNQLSYKSQQAKNGAKGGAKSRRKPRNDKGKSRRKATANRPLSDRLGYPKEIERKIHLQTSQEEALRAVGTSSDSQASGSGATIVPLARDSGR